MTDQQQPQSWGRDRRGAVASADLNPMSLVGSFFLMLEHDKVVWQGCVVGEPFTGTFLVEIENSVEGAKRHQRLFSIRQLVESDPGEWRFYDDEAKMVEAYAEWHYTTRETT